MKNTEKHSSSSKFLTVKTVRPDGKGRVTLGKRTKEFSGYTLKESATAPSFWNP